MKIRLGMFAVPFGVATCAHQPSLSGYRSFLRAASWCSRRDAMSRVGGIFGRAFTWSPAHTDKLVHLVLGFSLLSMSTRLLTQKNRMEDEKAELQKRLDQDLEDSVRRRQRLLLLAPALAKSAGLSVSASAQFGAALGALDVEPLPAAAAAEADVVQRPPPVDPRAALAEGSENKAVAIF